MFEGPAPRVFGVAPGVDFPNALLFGLEQRLGPAAPAEWAKVELYVNTRRMERRLRALFDAGPARLLPRIRLITDIGQTTTLPPAVPALRRRLELSQLVADLLHRQPDLAPRTAIFDLADSLANLMDEMQGEGVEPRALHQLDVSHLSAHWERTRAFIGIVERFFGADSHEAATTEARQRAIVEALIAQWAQSPPQHPIIVAGSTGSRGATALFMQAVARLPQGAVILPGYDFHQPQSVWNSLGDALTAEDHPQFRFRKIIDALDLDPTDVAPWTTALSEPNPARNRFVSLALRPAPITDQWMDEGQNLADLTATTDQMTLIEAPSPRSEALAIALKLREAAEKGVSAALITPDRLLTRQVTAALDRWGIEPDDSAGIPLQLSAPGRFLRHVAALFGQKLTAEALLTLLKHPLTFSAQGRGNHLRWTRELELKLRRYGPPFPAGPDLIHWAEAQKSDDGRIGWAHWLADTLAGLETVGTRSLTDHITQHLQLAEQLAGGPQATDAGGLWDKPAGKEARAAVDKLLQEAAHGGAMSPGDYGDLFRAVLGQHEVRDPSRPHPGVMIWGTLEARVQGADLVILGGLNEGSWPELPAPDAWLNREMRQKLGLLLPERRIGLSAHDFQQAVAAPEVVLSRSVRDTEAETVPSRWINRMTNLLNGLPQQAGQVALSQMRARGTYWLGLAQALDEPDRAIDPAPRPAPCPPIATRPDQLSVTRIQTLIRDPYAIYAAYILNLKPLDSLRQAPDAPLRGTILHRVMERFIAESPDLDLDAGRQRLLEIADEVFATDAPWPAARRMWRARLARSANWFLLGEAARQQNAHWVALEEKGSVTLQNGFVLTAEADRIDLGRDGNLIIYDYKTGTPPSEKQVTEFDKQLLLEAAMAERGGFDKLAPAPVGQVAYIGLGNKPVVRAIDLSEQLIARTWADLHELIDAYAAPTKGYAARRIMASRTDHTDYDQLSRFGEWDEGQPATLIEVGE